MSFRIATLRRADRIVPVFTAIALGGLLIAGQPSPAFAEDAPAAKTTSSAQNEKAAAAKPVDRAEARIKELHTKLHITEAQEPEWNHLVEVMRDNAQQMSSLIEERGHRAKTATAVDDLKGYQQIAEAHEDGLKKLVPAFEALYNDLSPEQKKAADAVFRGSGQRGQAS